MPDGPQKKPHLSMPCYLETSTPRTAERRAAWHADCPLPDECECLAHKKDTAATRKAKHSEWTEHRGTASGASARRVRGSYGVDGRGSQR